MATDPYKRHSTRNRGISFRLKANGSRSYFVYAQGRHIPVDGGEREALALQAEMRGRSARGERVAARSVKLAALAEEWYRSKGALREATLSDYRADLNNVILPRLGHLKVGRVTADVIAALIHDLRGKGLSGSRIKNILKPLNGTLKLALRRSLISQNPYEQLTADERPTSRNREHHIWSPEEINKLIDASKALARERDSKYDYSLLLYVAVYTGLRLGELLGLRWRDLDLKRGAIDVRHQISREGKLVEPKTRQAIRTVPLPADMTAALKRHKLASPFSADTAFVFASKTGTALNRSNVRNRGLAPALEAAGLSGRTPMITFHDLRHAFASIMIAQGITSIVLAKVLGHTDSRTTERIYIHVFDRERTEDRVRDAMQAAIRL